MRELPILFSAPLVRSILAGTKSVTRRPVKFRPDPLTPPTINGLDNVRGRLLWSSGVNLFELPCPFGAAGDRLWVRETWSQDCRTVYPCPPCWYRADFTEQDDPVAEMERHALHCARRVDPRAIGHGDCWACAAETDGFKWRPSIHMPRWASRITLEVTGVSVERLQDITEEDAKAEGIEPTNGHPERGAVFGCGPSCREGFAQKWIDIYGAESWDANGFCWVVRFRRVS